MRLSPLALAAAFAVSACASTTATQLSNNQFLISTSAAPACGSTGAAEVGAKMAAVETIRNGFERYIIQGTQSESDVRVVNMPPTGAHSTGTFQTQGGTTTGTMNTTFTGGGPIITGRHENELVVLMLNPDDPGFEHGVDARRTLGAEWQDLVESGIRTC